METGWGREEPVRLNLRQVRNLMSPSGWDCVGVDLVDEGRANTNYRVSCTDGSVLHLRLFQRDPASKPLEAAAITRFVGKLPVPRILFQGDGFTVSEWLPGKTVQTLVSEGRTDEVVSAASDLGQALATIASVKFASAGFLGPDLTVREPWNSPMGGLAGYLEMCLERPTLVDRCPDALISTIQQTFEEATPRMSEIASEPCLVHGDFKASNLLVNDGHLSGVLDWEFVHSGTWLLDAGQLTRNAAELPDAFLIEIERGLRSAGLKPPPDWHLLSRIVDLMSLVDFLGRKHSTQRLIDDVTSLIEATVEAWSRSVGR